MSPNRLSRFVLRDLDIRLPSTGLKGGLERALTSGRYENSEADAILAHLRPGDRFLDLGAGLGFICALAARVIGEDAVTGIEAGPSTIELARDNLVRNGFGGVQLRHGAVVGQVPASGMVEFGQRPAFWASAVVAGGRVSDRVVSVNVPALAAASLFAELRPTVLSCDIEGAELEVLTADLPECLRVIVTELHPDVYHSVGIKRIFDSLSAAGFVYNPRGSKAATLVFSRLDAPE